MGSPLRLAGNAVQPARGLASPPKGSRSLRAVETAHGPSTLKHVCAGSPTTSRRMGNSVISALGTPWDQVVRGRGIKGRLFRDSAA